MSDQIKLNPIVVKPNDGRTYPMGRMTAIFKADLEETNSSLSVSEWWLEPNTAGPEIHQHPEAHLFYVIDGTLSVFISGKDWFKAEKGSYIYIPGETEHGFKNTDKRKAGFISINTPGGFEKMAPQIAEYFADNPLGDARPKTI